MVGDEMWVAHNVGDGLVEVKTEGLMPHGGLPHNSGHGAGSRTSRAFAAAQAPVTRLRRLAD